MQREYLGNSAAKSNDFEQNSFSYRGFLLGIVTTFTGVSCPRDEKKKKKEKKKRGIRVTRASLCVLRSDVSSREDKRVSARGRSGEEKRRATRQRKLSRPRCRLDCSSHLRLRAGKKERRRKKRQRNAANNARNSTSDTKHRMPLLVRGTTRTNRQLRAVWPSSMTLLVWLPRFLSLLSSWENGMSPLRAERECLAAVV